MRFENYSGLKWHGHGMSLNREFKMYAEPVRFRFLERAMIKYFNEIPLIHLSLSRVLLFTQMRRRYRCGYPFSLPFNQIKFG